MSTTIRPLTSRTRLALTISRGVAAARGEQDLTAAHLALGILREGANPAVAALWYAGLSEQSIHALRVRIEDSMGKPPGKVEPRQVSIGLTPGEERLVSLAELQADNLGDEYLGTEHFMLALLHEDNAISEQLALQGVSVHVFVGALQAVRRGDPPPTEGTAV